MGPNSSTYEEFNESDELRCISSFSDDDDDNGGKKKKKIKWLEFNNTVDMEDPKFELGMPFSFAEAVKNAVKQHSIKHGKQLKLKVERTKVRAKCRDGCKWTLYASLCKVIPLCK